MLEARKVQPICFDDLLALYSDGCQKILQRYLKQISQHGTTSLHSLDTQFNTYNSSKQFIKKQLIDDIIQCQQIPPPYSHMKEKENTQNLIINSNSDNQNHNIIFNHQNVQFKSKHKLREAKSKIKDELVLVSAKIKKMSLDDKKEDIGFDFQSDEGETTLKKYDIVKQKSENELLLAQNINTLILESKKKTVLKNINNDHAINDEDIQIEDQRNSEYNMTDYSSNQSSNEGDYSAHYKDEDQNNNVKPLFGGLFKFHKITNLKTPSDSSDSSSKGELQFNLKAKQFLKSPKKSQKNKKRLFVGSKKIPTWAEDLQTIALQSRQNKNINIMKIYGDCKVEQLNTNMLFEVSDPIYRTSSAKWNNKIPYE